MVADSASTAASSGATVADDDTATKRHHPHPHNNNNNGTDRHDGDTTNTSTAHTPSTDRVVGTTSTKRVRLDHVTPAMLHTPAVAWPTVLLCVGASALWAATVWAYVHYHDDAAHRPSRWVVTPLSAVCIFALFTPLHDAVHGSVFSVFGAASPGLAATEDGWVGQLLPRSVRVVLNGLVGRWCALAFAAPFPAFRYVHLQHHKHTNDPDRDPDMWSGVRPALFMPLRWVSQEWHYYVPYFQALRQHSLSEVVECLVTLVVTYGWMWRQWTSDNPAATDALLWCWVVPLRMAVCVLACVFDYIPHRPHTVRRADDIYGCTAKLDGLSATPGADGGWVDGTVWTLPLLYQNYHNVHHLYPNIPFYKYSAVWWRNRTQLLALGTPVQPLYSHATPWF